MRCGRIRRLLSVYADEQTTERERLRVGLHLTRCRDCRKRLEELRLFRLTLQASPRAVVPADFSAAWRARLRQEAAAPKTKPTPNWSWRVLALAPVAACILLVVAGLAVFRPRLPGRGMAPAPISESQSVRPRTPVKARPPQLSGSPPARQPSPAVGSATNRPAPAQAPAEGGAGLPVDQGTGHDAADDSRTAPAVPGPAAASAGEPAARAGAAPVLPGINKAALDRPAPIAGSWRIWLTSVGPRPSAVKRVLVDRGLLRRVDYSTSLDAPLLLCQGLAYPEAQDLAQRLQEAGARTILELMPR